MEANTNTSTNSTNSVSALKDKFLKEVSIMMNGKNVHIDNFDCEQALLSLRFIFCDRKESSKHATVSVYNPMYDEHIDIDKNIAPLIELLWLNGISTLLSCENNVPRKHIWIYFETASDLESFSDIVFGDYDSSDEDENDSDTDFYDRGYPGNFSKKDGWYYDLCVDRNRDEDRKIKTTSIGVSVRVPQKDYETILNKFKSHSASKIKNNIQILTDRRIINT